MKEKLYLIKEGEWTMWRETIADAIRDFYKVYSLYPDILQANDFTHSQFDFLINIMQERQDVEIRDVTGAISLPDKTGMIILSGFVLYKDFNYIIANVEFYVDNQLEDKEFRLAYDDEAEWDESSVPEDCPEEELETILETM